MENTKNQDDFHPTGSMAFFLALIAVFALIWLSVYALMISRGVV